MLALLTAGTAAAHVPMLRGHLVELTKRADTIIVAKVIEVAADDTATIEPLTLLAGPRVGRLVMPADGNLARGETQLLFLAHGTQTQSIAPRGVVFLVAPEQTALLRTLIQKLRAALVLPETSQPDAVRAALIPCLGSTMTALRYDCAMTLSALMDDGHGPTSDERKTIDRLMSAPNNDAALRDMLRR